MRILWILLLIAPALAGCTTGSDAPEPPTTTNPTMLADGVSFQAIGEVTNASAEALLATAEGTYYSIGQRTFEPTIGATSTGGVFMSAFRGLGAGTDIRRTMDNGQTWETVTPTLPTGTKAVPNSNDPFMYVDQLTDRIYDFDMCVTLSGFCVSFSDDDGETWTTISVATGASGALDHQSLAAAPPMGEAITLGYDNVLTFCVNRGTTITGSWCSSSFDGGINWSPLVPGFPVDSIQCSGLSGHVWGSSDGRFYRGNPACDGPSVYRSEDGGLTWTEHVITTAMGTQGHEIAVAADGAGGVYAFWINDEGMPVLAVSNDHAETWSAPHIVAADGVTAAGFPTIAAAAPGHVAFAYIGTTIEDGYQGSTDDMNWNGYLGITLDALAANFTVANVQVNSDEDPLDAGRPCGRMRCGGFGDFIDITIDAEGRPWAALAHNGNDNFGIVGTLAAGPSLWGNGTLPALPVGGATAWE